MEISEQMKRNFREAMKIAALVLFSFIGFVLVIFFSMRTESCLGPGHAISKSKKEVAKPAPVKRPSDVPMLQNLVLVLEGCKDVTISGKTERLCLYRDADKNATYWVSSKGSFFCGANERPTKEAGKSKKSKKAKKSKPDGDKVTVNLTINQNISQSASAKITQKKIVIKQISN